MDYSKRALHKIEPYLYLLPAGLLLFLFIYYPFAKNLVGSFFIVDSFGKMKKFTGLENYTAIFHNEMFMKAIGNTLMFVVVSVPASIAAGLILALLAGKRRKASPVYEAVYAIPMAMSLSVVAMIFQLALNPTLGAVNKFLGINLNWLKDGDTALGSLIFIQIWLNIGYCFLFMLSAIRGISPEILESCEMDGVTGWRKLKSFIIPLVSPTILFLIVSSIAHNMMTAGLTLILTQGGPNGSTETIVSYIYTNAIRNMNYNLGNAAAMIGFAIAFVLILVSFIYEKKGVHYD